MRLTTDLFAYCAERIPNWNTISISGYHIREAGSTAVQELAFTLANGIAYCDAAVAAGLSPDDFGERLSFFFNAHNDFFQEVAKFRAARRLWARIMRERFGATNPKAQALRFHAQTGGSTLTAQQPREQRRARRDPGAVGGLRRRAVAAHELVRRGARAAVASTRRGSRCARSRFSRPRRARPTPPIRSAARTTSRRSPTSSSARALELIERVDELGGAVAAVEQGFVQDEIEQAAFRYQQQVESGERVDRRRQPLPRGRRGADRAAPARSRGRAAAARAHGAGARGAECRRGAGGDRARARRGARHREHAAAAARRACARAARSARSATCCARSGGCTTGSARPRERRARLSPRDERRGGRHRRGRGAHGRDEAERLQGLRRRRAAAARARRSPGRCCRTAPASSARRNAATTAAARSTGARTRARARSSPSRRTSRAPDGLYSFDALTPGLVRIGDDVRELLGVTRQRRSSSSPASTRGRAGSTWSAGTGTCGGTRERCSRTCSRSRPPRASSRGSTPRSSTPR